MIAHPYHSNRRPPSRAELLNQLPTYVTAGVIDVTQQSIRNWRRGLHKPRFSNARRWGLLDLAIRLAREEGLDTMADKLARQIMLVKVKDVLRWQARNRVPSSRGRPGSRSSRGLVRCLDGKLHDPTYRLAPSVENWLLRIAATALRLAVEDAAVAPCRGVQPRLRNASTQKKERGHERVREEATRGP